LPFACASFSCDSASPDCYRFSPVDGSSFSPVNRPISVVLQHSKNQPLAYSLRGLFWAFTENIARLTMSLN